jgi:methyl-accepting chemotaxis protein
MFNGILMNTLSGEPDLVSIYSIWKPNAMDGMVGSQQILEVIGQLNDITQMVKGGSDAMLDGSRGVITEGRNLEMATAEITNGMNEMANGADQINVAVHRVNEISGENKENIDILVKEVSRFKVE